jgi:single-stranded DNA-binding protein
MSFERLTVVGNIGSAEVLKSQRGNAYLRMSVAVNRIAGNTKSVVWYSVLLFGGMVKDADSLCARYRPGRLVLVEGRPQTEVFVKRDGSYGLDNTIVAISMPELLDAKPA